VTLPPLPLAYLFSGLALILLLRVFLPGLNVLAWPLAALGSGLLAGGLLTLLAGVLALLRRRTTVTFARSSALVTGGIYRWTRNPIYLALVLILLGAGLLSGNLAALAVPLAAFAALDRHFIPLEEAKTERELGEAYRQYRKRTRRWL